MSVMKIPAPDATFVDLGAAALLFAASSCWEGRLVVALACDKEAIKVEGTALICSIGGGVTGTACNWVVEKMDDRRNTTKALLVCRNKQIAAVRMDKDFILRTTKEVRIYQFNVNFSFSSLEETKP